jgi:hypothetical protein
MSDDLFSAEMEATRSLVELYDQAKKCQALFERAHMALPEPLRRVLGINAIGERSAAPPNIAAPEKPPMPLDAGPDWVWIKASDASVATVILAILRSAKSALRPKELIERVTAIIPAAPPGSIYNVGPRLEKAGIISRNEEGWSLIKTETAGLINKGYFWGPPAAFGKPEMAAQRRAALLHVLGFHPTGLQIVQILEQLKRCSWVIAPINKDLVKEDIGVLSQAGTVRRRGNTKNWEIPREKSEASV